MMFDNVKEVFKAFTFLGPKDLLQIASISKIRIIKKDEHFLHEGDMNYDVGSVIKGLLRHYVIDKNGVEKTLRFVTEREPFGSMETILRNKPAAENIVAMDHSIILKLDSRQIERLAESNIRLLKLQNQYFRQIISSNVDHIKFLNVLTADERYEYFCTNYPDLEQRVKQKYLASYLGITPTSLSRLRARRLNK